MQCSYMCWRSISSSVRRLLSSVDSAHKPLFSESCITIASAIIMPWLGASNNRLALQTNSGALRADAAQSNVCAYMAWIALAGLVTNAVLHIPGADSIAALLLLSLVLHEENEVRKGESCNC